MQLYNRLNDENGDENGKEKALWIPALIALAGAALLVAAYFLPCFSVTQAGLERMADTADYEATFYDRYGLTYHDMAEMSLLKVLRMGVGMLEANLWEGDWDIALLLLAILAAPLVSSVLMLAAAVRKDPLYLFFYDGLAFGAYLLIIYFYQFVFLCSGYYEMGIVACLYPIGACVVLAAALALSVMKYRLNAGRSEDYES